MSSMFPAKTGSVRTVLPYPAVVVHDLAQANAAMAEGLALIRDRKVIGKVVVTP